MSRWSRRRVLRTATVGAMAGLAGCEGGSSTSSPRGSDPAAATSITGQVVDGAGEPIADATVRATEGATRPIARTETDADGGFALDGIEAPVWVTVTADGSVPETIAMAPGASRVIGLAPREGVVSLTLGVGITLSRPMASLFSLRHPQRRPLLRKNGGLGTHGSRSIHRERV